MREEQADKIIDLLGRLVKQGEPEERTISVTDYFGEAVDCSRLIDGSDRSKVVYISGPITMDRVGAPKRFIEAAERIRACQMVPLNPFDVGPACGDQGCIGNARNLKDADINNGHHWSCWVKADLQAMLDGADAILMLAGWEKSRGACLELTVAEACGLEVLYDTFAFQHSDGPAPAWNMTDVYASWDALRKGYGQKDVQH